MPDQVRMICPECPGTLKPVGERLSWAISDIEFRCGVCGWSTWDAMGKAWPSTYG
jgi:hypothetical protein